MSIVAERPVNVQFAAPVSAGLLEEIERQEREDDVLGPEPEGAWSRRERALEARRAVAVPARRRVTPSYTAPERVDLRTAEDRPLSAVQAERVGRLAAEHHDHLVRYVQARLGGWAYWSQAEDVAQDVWVHVARGRVPELLKAEPDYAWPRLAAAAKWSLLEDTTTKRRREWLVRVPEGDDRSADEVLESLAGPGLCAALELLEEEGEPAGAGWAPACYAERIAALPARQREVLELRCVDGMTTPAMAALLGISRQSVESALRKALTALGGSGRMPGARTRGAGEPLPEGWEKVLDRLPSQTQRDVVRLRASGASFKELSDELGIHRGYSHELYTRALRLLREMAVDHRMDPEPAAPTKCKPKPVLAPKSCAGQCASGCYLRTAGPAVQA